MNTTLSAFMILTSTQILSAAEIPYIRAERPAAVNSANKKMFHSVTSGYGGKCLDIKDPGIFHIWEKETIAYLNGSKAEIAK